MKKIVVLFALFLILGANIEALASGESGASNTGPREEKKCYGGGHKMVCRSINSESCTDSDCY